jgi:hypothetical protein
VGINLHRRRSVIVRRDPNGEVLASTRIDNDPGALAAVVADAGPEPEVVLEADDIRQALEYTAEAVRER